jgi:tetratricopeptide (TPR) repeat protein
VLFPLAILALAEGALRLGGYGHSTRFFESHPDGLSLSTNPQFAWSFYSRETSTAPTPMRFTAGKTPGTVRIVVLGESAVAGTPDPAFSFSRMLELMLQRQYPSNRFEVLNAAMRGINSHIIRHIARECAALSPDLFIVYMGNNELIGLHAPAPEGFNFTPHLRLLRLGDAIKTTRLSQLLGAIVRRFATKAERKMQDMEYLRRQRLAFDHPRRQSAYENFRANLEDVCDLAERSGAQTILASVGVNLHDFPPLGSLHRPNLASASPADFEQAYSQGVAAESRQQTNEALARFEAAVRLDPHFAELHFRLARCYEAAGKLDLARQHYSLACDWDALQFRADRRINEMIRLAAERRRSRGVLFADAAAAFAAGPLAENGVPGARLFNDHVHFTFDGDYQLARFLLPSVGTALRLGPGSAPPPTRDECALALGFTPVDEMNVLAAMAQQTSKPPFLDQLEHAQRQAEADRRVRERLSRTTMRDFEQAAAVYRSAIARNPDDWMLRYNFGRLFSQFGQPAKAAAEYEFVVKRLPRQRVFRLNLGDALLQSGRPTEALAQYRAALEIDPDFAPAKEAIASAHRRAR